ncbi:MAG: glycosyltransferase family 2 protein [Burkholderiales bacterium]|nr:glycosyltransferase family 2 protein [Burkholderiales bacterium]
MDLSIIIVNWNSKDYLAKAISSIFAATRSMSFEVLVIDSGSFDGCAEMLQTTHPDVVFIQSRHNLGFAAANNAAFRAARGRIILFLNPDTEILGNAIEQLYSRLTGMPQAGIVGPKLLNSDGSVQDTCVRAFPTILNQFLDSDLLRTRFPQAALWGKQTLSVQTDLPMKVEAVSGACLMIKRSVFEAVGLFSTDYFMYAEDMDLCLKTSRAGFSAYYVPTAVVVHHGGASSAQAPANTFSAVMALESQWRFFRKTRSWHYAALYRAAMFSAAVLRVSALALAWPMRGLHNRNWRGAQALRKWMARLRWALGGERWVRNY